MKTHPYIRAYMAGLCIPSLALPALLLAGLALRVILNDPYPFERGLIFPMAFVPLLWGVWNSLWLAIHERTNLPLSMHGAILPLLLLPPGTLVAHTLGILRLGSTGATWFGDIDVPYAWIAPCFIAVVAGYYLVWKHAVGFLNRMLGIG